MSKQTIYFFLFVLLLLFLSACGREKEAESVVQPIDEEVDVCEVCYMSVLDNQFSAQLLSRKGETLKFDDIGCLADYLRDHEEAGEAYVRDYYTKDWLKGTEAIFIESAELTTPMHSGVVSFQNEDNAAKFLKETEGQRISWEAVLTNTKGHNSDESQSSDY